MTPHGDRRRYRAGCRCLPCRAAAAAYMRCRRQGALLPDPSELVDASLAEMHLLTLRGQGVGYRQAAKLAGVSDRLVADVRAGRKTQVQADILTRILAVQPILAHGQSVTGWRTWRLLDSLEREGFTRRALGTKLGFRARQLQIGRRRLRVRNALKVRVLYAKVNDLPLKEAHDRHIR